LEVVVIVGKKRTLILILIIRFDTGRGRIESVGSSVAVAAAVAAIGSVG